MPCLLIFYQNILNTHTHTDRHTYIPKLNHTHTHTHTYTHTYKNTHILVETGKEIYSFFNLGMKER